MALAAGVPRAAWQEKGLAEPSCSMGIHNPWQCGAAPCSVQQDHLKRCHQATVQRHKPSVTHKQQLNWNKILWPETWSCFSLASILMSHFRGIALFAGEFESSDHLTKYQFSLFLKDEGKEGCLFGICYSKILIQEASKLKQGLLSLRTGMKKPEDKIFFEGFVWGWKVEVACCQSLPNNLH